MNLKSINMTETLEREAIINSLTQLEVDQLKELKKIYTEKTGNHTIENVHFEIQYTNLKTEILLFLQLKNFLEIVNEDSKFLCIFADDMLDVINSI